MYKFKISKLFEKKVKKLTTKNEELKMLILAKLELLALDPFNITLKSHKVHASKISQKVYSSSINGNIRIIWDFDNEEINIIELLSIGGHDGKDGVYK
jgi:mRNA interferase YafQ